MFRCQLPRAEGIDDKGLIPMLSMQEYINSQGDATVFSTLVQKSDIGRSSSPSMVATKRYSLLTANFSLYKSFMWSGECLKNFSTHDGRPPDEGKMTVCLVLFKRYRNYLENVR